MSLIVRQHSISRSNTKRAQSRRKAPSYPRPGGFTYMLGLMLSVKKIYSFQKIYLKYKMNKHVESLPKVDKSITFHYCTVICDVLWPIDVIFVKRQHKLYMIFCFSIFFKVGKFETFSERPKTKSVLASEGFRPPDSLTRGSAPGLRLTLVFGGGAPTL